MWRNGKGPKTILGCLESHNTVTYEQRPMVDRGAGGEVPPDSKQQTQSSVLAAAAAGMLLDDVSVVLFFTVYCDWGCDSRLLVGFVS